MNTALIDPRGARFGAAISSGLLALALFLGERWGLVPLGIALVAFAIGAFAGPKYQPWSVLFRELIRPRLPAPKELEDARPPRFAQLVGFIFALVGVVGALLGLPVLYLVAVGFALAATLLNAVFDFCLGCEIWVLYQRARYRVSPVRRVPAAQ